MTVKPRVLVVDDELDMLELAEYHLQREGLEVFCASNGLEALRRARCDSPDVIVLDIMLPDLDGHSVGEILGVQPSTKDIPVVVLSALDQPIGKGRSARLVHFRWVKKGSDIGCLTQSVREALEESIGRRKPRRGSGKQDVSLLED